MNDDPDLIVVSYGTPSRVVNTAVAKARSQGMKVGALRLINLWPSRMISSPQRQSTLCGTQLEEDFLWSNPLPVPLYETSPIWPLGYFEGNILEFLRNFRELTSDKTLAE